MVPLAGFIVFFEDIEFFDIEQAHGSSVYGCLFVAFYEGNILHA